jgi:hypothetical protein
VCGRRKREGAFVSFLNIKHNRSAMAAVQGSDEAHPFLHITLLHLS